VGVAWTNHRAHAWPLPLRGVLTCLDARHVPLATVVVCHEIEASKIGCVVSSLLCSPSSGRVLPGSLL
jgi:hypothetical protein